VTFLSAGESTTTFFILPLDSSCQRENPLLAFGFGMLAVLMTQRKS
jgi:hypothetical protein